MEDFLNDTLIKLYSQERYDFDVNALSPVEVMQVKNLAMEKRAEYGIAPIGKEIFRYIREKESSIYFESESFENDNLDALIYLRDPNKDTAFIILNSNQPLLNQIFATAHEYYHYIKDLDTIRYNPHVCSLSRLKDKNEQKASRFAAEFLLPDQALKKHVDQWLVLINKKEFKEAKLGEVAILCYVLTMYYCMPLKAVMFRLYEEGYISDISVYISNYAFIKQVLIESKTRFLKQVQELMGVENPYIEEIMYNLIPKAYRSGYVSIDKVENDIKVLGINEENIMGLLNVENYEDDEDIDENLRGKLLKKLREKG